MDNFALNTTDYVILVVLLFSTLISLVRGFVREALSLTSWIVSVWVAIKFSPLLSLQLESYIANAQLRSGVAFFCLFAITLIIGAMLGFLVAQIVQKSGLTGTDRLLGLIFGFGRGTLVVATLLLLVGLVNFPQGAWWSESVLIPQFEPMAVWLEGFLPKDLAIKLT